MPSNLVGPLRTPPAEVEEVVQECAAAFGANIVAILWHGSRARGEERPWSDNDLVVILHEVDEAVLLRMREIFVGRHDWSSVIWSEKEIHQLPRDRLLQLAYGFRVLHGDFEPVRPTRGDLVAELRSLAEEITFQCRYRLIHKHGEAARQVRMMHYMAKNAVLAMKARHLLEQGDYPVTRDALLPAVADPEERQIIEWIDRWDDHRPGFEANPLPLMLRLDRFARRLVDRLDDWTGTGGVGLSSS